MKNRFVLIPLFFILLQGCRDDKYEDDFKDFLINDAGSVLSYFPFSPEIQSKIEHKSYKTLESNPSIDSCSILLARLAERKRYLELTITLKLLAQKSDSRLYLAKDILGHDKKRNTYVAYAFLVAVKNFDRKAIISNEIETFCKTLQGKGYDRKIIPGYSDSNLWDLIRQESVYESSAF